MRDSSSDRLTALAYYMLLVIGVAFSLAGVVTKAVAETYAVDPSSIGYRFTLFSVGYSVAILCNGFALEKVNIRKETLVASALAALAILGATCYNAISAFSFFILLYGLAMGILCSIGYYLVVNLHGEASRATKLNMLNFFFSIGAIFAPILAGQALEHGLGWQHVLQATLVLIAAIIVVTCFSRRFEVRPRRKTAVDESGFAAGWNATVYIMGLALFCYVVSEMVFTYWVVLYMMERLALNVALASLSLSIFWSFMAAGRLLAGIFITRFRLVTYLLACSGLSFIAFGGLLQAQSSTAAMTFIALMGFGYSGLYATIMSYGTLQLPRPSSKLTTFFLTVGALAGVLSFLLSSYLKANYDVMTVMFLSAGLMGTVMLLTAFAGVRGFRVGGA